MEIIISISKGSSNLNYIYIKHKYLKFLINIIVDAINGGNTFKLISFASDNGLLHLYWVRFCLRAIAYLTTSGLVNMGLFSSCNKVSRAGLELVHSSPRHGFGSALPWFSWAFPHGHRISHCSCSKQEGNRNRHSSEASRPWPGRKIILRHPPSCPAAFSLGHLVGHMAIPGHRRGCEWSTCHFQPQEWERDLQQGKT